MRFGVWHGLSLVPNCNGTPVEISFPANGFVFLVSERTKLMLTDIPGHDVLKYIVFVKKWNGIFGISLRADSSVDGNKISLLHKGSKICAGRMVFAVEATKNSQKIPYLRRMTIFKTICVFFIIVFVIRLTIIVNAAIAPPINKPPNIVAQTQDVSSRNADSLIEEAKRLIHAGRNEQARLALIEAAEIDQNGEATKILSALDNGASQHSLEPMQTNTANVESMAQELFDKGREKIVGGDIFSAYRNFVKAREILQRLDTSPPFAEALGDALQETKIAVEHDVEQKLNYIEGLIATARSKDGEGAALDLVKASLLAREIEKTFPEGKRVGSVAAHSQREMAAALGRLLAAARAAERLSGCEKARPIYEKITQALYNTGDIHEIEAQKFLSGCNNETRTVK